jgi:AraC-like DNA-binding protein
MQRFTSDQLPQRDRLAIWREVFGREVFRIDIEAAPDSQFVADVTVHALPGLTLLSGTLGAGVHARRTPELISDANGDLLFIVNRVGRISVSQRGQDRSLDGGDAALGSLGEVGGIFRETAGESFSLQIPRATLAPLITNLDDAVMRPIPRDRAPLRLLIPYLDLLQQSGTLAAPDLAQSAVRHICDLVILMISRGSDATETARGRGARAARLATIKADIVANIARPDLSAEMIARRHGLSPRHVHRLFEQDDRSFAQFIMEMKLSCAYRMLTDPELSEWSIAAIAEQAGFVERSHFNRALRLRYGASPSELRASVQRGGEE